MKHNNSVASQVKHSMDFSTLAFLVEVVCDKPPYGTNYVEYYDNVKKDFLEKVRQTKLKGVIINDMQLSPSVTIITNKETWDKLIVEVDEAMDQLPQTEFRVYLTTTYSQNINDLQEAI